MARVKAWTDRYHSDKFLPEEDLKKMYEFCMLHRHIYIYGQGKIGKAMECYLSQSEIHIDGFVTSDTIKEFSKSYVPGETGIIIGVNETNYKEISPLLRTYVNESDTFCLDFERLRLIETMFTYESIEQGFSLSVFITLHCNLNCKSCRTCAPICEKWFYDFDSFRKDVQRLKDMNFTAMKVIQFTGGEPLLHPQWIDMMEYVVQTFPETETKVYTNGLLINSLTAQQLDRLRNLKTIIMITEYPTNTNMIESLIKLLTAAQITCGVITMEGEKLFTKIPLNFTKSAPLYEFGNCYNYKTCYSLDLWEGKLYHCCKQIISQLFNKTFGTNLELTEDDYLDLYSVTPDDVYRYKLTRAPFCGYCDYSRSEHIKWGLSERNLEEWI